MPDSSNHHRMQRGNLWLAGCALALLILAGCEGGGRYDLNNRYTEPARLNRGLVTILPGIEGESSANRDIREGLYDANIPYGLVIYRWGTMVPGPAGMLINQTDVEGNRRSAAELAGQIAQYQTRHPDKPVFLIGHSGGGGVAVFTLEALGRMPGARPVEGAFLLSSSISSDYDLTAALRMCRRGLVNVSNMDDEILNSGTAMVGNVDGVKGPSAGRTGFTRRYAKVFERPITNEQARRDLGIGGSAHFVATKPQLIEKYAPAWLLSETWPPARLGVRP